MKYRQFYFLMILMVYTSATVNAQSSRVVQGMLRDSSLRIVAGASIQLLTDKDSTGTSSSVGGIFTFNNISAENFKIKINSIGFEPFEKEYSFPRGQEKIMLPSIVLKGLPNMLEEIVINGVITVQVKGDTVEYATKDLKLREGAVAEDALKRLQGVEVDKDGNVTAQGESITRVRINGKDFFGGDVKTATKNLPANIIEKIQVVDDFGDMANITGNKSGDSEKVLNIQIDPKYNSGWMTTLRVGAGTSDRYQATGMWMGLTDKSQVSVLGNLNNMNAQLFDFQTTGGGTRRRQGGGGRPGGMPGGGANGLTNTGSIGLNVRHDFSEKLKVYGSYSYGRDDNSVLSSSNRLYTFEDGEQEDIDSTDANTITTKHRFESNIEWNISPRDYIKITPQLGFENGEEISTSMSSSFFRSILDNEQTLTTNSTGNSPRFGISGLYNRKLNDKGRNLFFNFNYDNAKTENNYIRELDRQVADRINPGNASTKKYELTDQTINNKSWNAGSSISYTEPLSEASKLEFNYDLNLNSYNNSNNQNAKNEDNTPNLEEKLNFDYLNDYSFTTHRLAASYAFENEKIKYSVGASAQPTLLSGQASSSSEFILIDRKNLNIIPVARFEYKFSRQSNLTLNYSGNPTEPSVSQLLPFEVTTNRTNTVIGNPNLDPEFTHNMRLRYRAGDFQKGKSFFAMINSSLTTDKIVSSIKQFRDESAPISDQIGLQQEITYLNESNENVYNVNSFYHLGRSFKENTYSIMLGGGASFSKGISYVTEDRLADIGNKNIQNNMILTQTLGFRYLPSENLEINPGVRFSYNHTTNSVNSRTENTTSVIPNIVGSVNISPSTIFGADLSKTFNYGFRTGDVNPFIINTYIEQRFFKDQRGTLRLQAFDLLNEQTNISRAVGSNSITDSQTNRLARYFMLSFTFRLQKFALGAPQEENRFPGGMRPPRM